MLLLLLACASSDKDTSTLSACDCGQDPATLGLTVSDAGGFDTWSGAALAWAVDEQEGRVLVAGMRYETGVGHIDMEVACDDPDALVGSWVAAIPPSAQSAAARYPLLAAALTTDAGVRSFASDVGVLLLEGDVSAPTPDRIFVGTGGTLTLLRNDGGDGLQGAVEFAAVADAVGGHAEPDCEGALRIGALDIPFDSTGED